MRIYVTGLLALLAAAPVSAFDVSQPPARAADQVQGPNLAPPEARPVPAAVQPDGGSIR